VNYRVLSGALVHLGDECKEIQAGQLVFANSLRLVWAISLESEKDRDCTLSTGSL